MSKRFAILEIPSADGLPAAENCCGLDHLRTHFEMIFQLFKVQHVRDDDFQLHAVGDLVFLRTTATIEYLPAGRTYSSRHLNEFEFRDGKIARRTVISDYSSLRDIFAPPMPPRIARSVARTS